MIGIRLTDIRLERRVVLLLIAASLALATVTTVTHLYFGLGMWHPTALEEFSTQALSNLIMAMFAAVMMLVAFDRLAARKLRAIAAQAGAELWMLNDSTITLDRQAGEAPDDIDEIMAALNNAKSEFRAAYRALEEQAAMVTRMNARLREANREQAAFTYAISHDLKSPTNTLQLLIKELEIGDGPRLSDEGREIVQSAGETLSRMGQLIEDILGYARAVEQEMTVERVELGTIIAAISEDLRGDIAAARARIEAGELPAVAGNPAQLRLLFQNLIANAIKFRTKGRTPEITVASARSGHSGKAVISVADNGIGIAPEYHDKIFGLFQRLHTNDIYPGSGLGLALCRRVVNNHGGTLSLTSVPDQGTTFRVMLDLHN
jgi:light-regulated signal transduction histidine kinase (bacteriophytochrome)